MQIRLAALALTLLAPAALALEGLPEAPRLADAYRNGVSLERYDGGEVTCMNGAFATLTLLAPGLALLAIESPTCVTFAGPFTATGSFEDGWELDYAVPTAGSSYHATLGADPELPTFAFRSFSTEPTTGATTLVLAHGYLRAVVGEPSIGR